MGLSKWYLVQGQSQENGVYAIIKEELTDLIVASFPPIGRHEAKEMALNLEAIIKEHNKTVKLFNPEHQTT